MAVFLRLKSLVAHLGTALIRSNGGVATSVRQFKDALDGFVVSMKEARHSGTDELYPDYNYINSNPLFGKYCLPTGSEARRVRELLKDVGLLTCHNLYRGHVHFVDSAYRRRGVPYWVVPHGVLDPYVFKTNWLVKRSWMAAIGKRFLRSARVVVYATRREREKAEINACNPNGVVVNWPISLPEAMSEELRLGLKRELRESLGLKPGTRILLSFGRLHTVKRIPAVIDAVAAAATDVHLLIVGPDGDITAREIQRIIALKKAKASIQGPVYGVQKANLLHAVDGYVSLSAKENFNNTAAEAMAFSRPVILSSGNDLVGDLRGVECGWLLQEDKPELAVAAIRDFARSSDEELESMGKRSALWVEENLSRETFQRRLSTLVLETASPALSERLITP